MSFNIAFASDDVTLYQGTKTTRARAAGYTVPILVESYGESFEALARPDTDYETDFKCFDTDAEEYVRVEGYNVSVS